MLKQMTEKQESVLEELLMIAESTLGLKQDDIDVNANIMQFGIDSLMLIKLGQEIEALFHVELEMKWFFVTMPSFITLAEHVAERMPVPKRSVAMASSPKEAEAISLIDTIPEAQQEVSSRKNQDFLLTEADHDSQQGVMSVFFAQLQTLQTVFTKQFDTIDSYYSNQHQPLTSIPEINTSPDTEPQKLAVSPSAPKAQSTNEVQKDITAGRTSNIRGFKLDEDNLTPAQSDFVSALTKEYIQKTKKSKSLSRKNKILTDWKSSFAYRKELKETAYSIAASTTHGGYMVDVDDNNYIDIALGMGVSLLGHNPDFVTKAIEKRLKSGFGLGPQCDRTAEAAEKISMLTGAERVSFCNTGTEAVMFAMRLARASSGKSIIAIFNGSYHGTFDGILGHGGNGKPVSHSPGTPLAMVENTLMLDYNQDSSFTILDKYKDKIAAVLVEPVQSRKPDLQPQTFLRRLRRYTREHDICLIFDEMINGFRTAPDGAQGHFNIAADIALYGKVIGGGMPVGVIAGKAKYLDYIDGGFLEEDLLPSSETIVFGGTFCRHPLAMEAVCATSDYMLQQGKSLQQHTNHNMEWLANDLNYWFQNNAVPLRVRHFSSQFLFEGFGLYSALLQPIELNLFFLKLITKGIFTWERRLCFIATTHDKKDLKQIIKSVKESIFELREGGFDFSLDHGTPQIFSHVSDTQKRLYAIFQNKDGQNAYHLPLAWTLTSSQTDYSSTKIPDIEQIEIALGECIKRHESLRSSFHIISGDLVQKTVDEPAFSVQRINATGKSVDAIFKSFIQPFDLETPPLLRAGIAQLDDHRWIFILDTLHINMDGASLGILISEFNQIMTGGTVECVPCQPKDFLSFVPKDTDSDTHYWLQKLEGIPRLDLPYDEVRKDKNQGGGQTWLTLTSQQTAHIKQACKTYSITTHMYLCGVYTLLLHKITGQTNFCVGLADGGRYDKRMEKAVGMFVNTVPQCFSLDKCQSLNEFFHAIKLSCIDAMEHNSSTYGHIVDSLGYSPIQTMLSYEKGDGRTLSFEGFTCEPVPPVSPAPMYDFSIDIVEIDEVINCNITYSNSFFNTTIEKFKTCFHTLIEETSFQSTQIINSTEPLSCLTPQPHRSPTINDTTVRYNGIQIDISVIEKAISDIEGITKSVVTVREGKLCGYFDSKDKEITAEKVRNSLFNLLPVHMVPCFIMRLGQDSSNEENNWADKNQLPLPQKETNRIHQEPETTIEKIMCRIWEQVLGVKKVGLNDNFFLLGGDSLKSMRVISTLAKQGYYLEMQDIFNTPLLAELVKIAQVEQEMVEEDTDVQQLDFPLTPILSKFFLNTTKENRKHFNQTIFLTKKSANKLIDNAVVATVLKVLTNHHAAFRTTFSDKMDVIIPAIASVDSGTFFEFKTIELQEDINYQEVHTYLEKVSPLFSLETGPLLKALLLKGLNGDGLVLMAHHTAVDAVSWRIFVEDFESSYIQYEEKQKITLPPSTAPFARWAKLLAQHAKTYTTQKQKQYWNQLNKTVVDTISVDKKIPCSQRLYSHTEKVKFYFPKSFLDQLQQKGYQNLSLKLDEILMSALIKGLHRWKGISSIALLLEGHGREPLHQKINVSRTIGWFTSTYPVIIENQNDLTATLVDVKERLRKVPGKGIGFTLLQQLDDFSNTHIEPEIDFNYLGEFTEDSHALFGLKYLEDAAETAPEIVRRTKLSVETAITAQGLGIAITYNSNEFDSTSIDRFIEFYKSTIEETLVTLSSMEKQITPSDLARHPVSIADLSQICQQTNSRPEEIEQIYNLSPMQHGMLFLSEYGNDPKTCFEQNMLHIKNHERNTSAPIFEIDRFHEKLEMVFKSYPIFRTNFISREIQTPKQVVLKRKALSFEVEYLSSVKDPNQHIEDYMQKERNAGFDLSCDTLCRVRVFKIGTDEYKILFSLHHILADRWSMDIIFNELFFNDKSESTLGLGEYNQYQDYIEWTEKNDPDEAKRYWHTLLSKHEEATLLLGQSTSEFGLCLRRHNFVIEEELSTFIRDFATNNRLTVNSVIQAIWGILLQRYNNRDEVVFGQTFSGRSAPVKDIDTGVGLYINTLPIFAVKSKNDTLRDFARTLQEQSLNAEKHAWFPLTDVQATSPLRNKLFQHIILIQDGTEELNAKKNAVNNFSLKYIEDQCFAQTGYDFLALFNLEKKITVHMDYNSKAIDQSSVEDIQSHFCALIKNISLEPMAKISDIDMVSQQESSKLLNDFNKVGSLSTPKGSYIDRFREQAYKTPLNTAVVAEDRTLSYKELDFLSDMLAFKLLEKGLQKEERIGVMLPRHTTFVISAIAVMKAGGCYVPLDGTHPKNRIETIFQDAGIKLLVTTEEYQEKFHNSGTTCIIAEKEIVINNNAFQKSTLKNIDPDIHKRLIESSPEPNDLAYIIYTSGSTGTPKGVMIEHKSLVNLCCHGIKEYLVDENSVSAPFVNFTFDISISEIYISLMAGGRVCIIPEGTRKNPPALFTFINQHGVNLLNLPTQFASVFIKEFPQIPSLRELLIGGDKLKTFVEADYKLINAYGPTENTVTTLEYHVKEISQNIPVGKPVNNVQVYVLNNDLKLQAIGIPGELCIAGPQLSRGYLNRPTLNAKVFVDNPYATSDETRTLYRTGDLAKWLPDGNIQYLGRIDQQVKIRGYRIELAEIELAIQQIPGIREACVQACEEQNGKYLCGYYITDKASNSQQDSQSLKALLSTKLTDYMVPSTFVEMEEFPLTSGGKIDKKRLPVPEKTISKNFIAPTTAVERLITELVSEVTGVKVVGLEDNFIELGGDSIKGILLLSRLSKQDYTLTVTELLGENSLGYISKKMMLKGQEQPESPLEQDTIQQEYNNSIQGWIDEDLPEKDIHLIYDTYRKKNVESIYSLTPMQKSILAQCVRQTVEGLNLNFQTTDDYIIYNSFNVAGEFDLHNFEIRVNELVQKHSVLRTVFINDRVTTPLQVVLKNRKPKFSHKDLSGKSDSEQKKVMDDTLQHLKARHLDLSADSLFVVHCFRLSDSETTVLILWHHLILDGWSLTILFEELFSDFPLKDPRTGLFHEKPIPFSEHLKALKQQNTNANSHWWEKKAHILQEDIRVFETEKIDNQGFTIGTKTLKFDNFFKDKLTTLSKEEKLPLSALLQAAWAILLSRYNNIDNIHFANVTSGRLYEVEDFHTLVGMCVTTLPVVAECSNELSFINLAKKIHLWNLEAGDHSSVEPSFIKNLAGGSYGEHLFVIENQAGINNEENSSLSSKYSISQNNSDSGHTGIPLAVEWEVDPSLICSLHYDTSKYDQWQVDGLAHHYKTILDTGIHSPKTVISSISMLTREDEIDLLTQVNGESVTSAKAPVATNYKNFVDLFGETAKKFPKKIALSSQSSSLTYKQLDGQTTDLASYLRRMGATTDRPVGICLPKGLELIIAMIAVMKSGSPYLPLDPDYPEERMTWLCNDAKIDIIITDNTFISRVANITSNLSHNGQQVSVINIDDEQVFQTIEQNPQWNISSNDLAYIIYTSGTTGKPKGVMIEHKGLVNLCLWQQMYFPASERDNYSLYAPIGFDASVYEIFPALSCGASLHIVPDNLRLDSEGLSLFFNENNITISFLPPQVGKQIIDLGKCQSLKLLTLAGDKPGQLAQENFKILNCYGPSEFTVCATSWQVDETTSQPPIGRPILNTHCYIIDKNGFPCPRGITGELCISGVQLARGYHNNKQQTQESFIANPFAQHLGQDDNPDYQRMYKTGDMCRLRPDGIIEFMRRTDDQIKIRGHRIEKGEIEFALAENPLVKESVVICHDEGGDASLHGYITLATQLEQHLVAGENQIVEAISEKLRKQLPHWMVPSTIMILDEFPLTDNGKLDEKNFPLPQLQQETYVAPETVEEKEIAKVFESVLQTSKIGKKDNFFHLGGDSIKAMLAISMLRQSGYILTVKTIFDQNVVEEIAKNIKILIPQVQSVSANTLGPSKNDLTLMEKFFESELLPSNTGILAPVIEDCYPLSPLQENMLSWYIEDEQSRIYHNQSAILLKGKFNIEEFRKRVVRLIQKNDTLRTVFFWKETPRPWQVVLSVKEPVIHYETLTNLTGIEQKNYIKDHLDRTRTKGFDFQKDMLLQFSIFKTDTERHTCTIFFPHLILDGWSIALLSQQLFNTVVDEELTPSPFKNFISYMWEQDTQLELAYWKKRLKNIENPALLKKTAGEAQFSNSYFALDKSMFDKMMILVKEQESTASTFLQVCWAITLSRFTGGDDVIFGTFSSNRPAEIENSELMMGLCLNTIPIYVSLKQGNSFTSLLKKHRDNSIADLAHCHLPLADIHRSTPLGKDLTQTLFLYQNYPPSATILDTELQIEHQSELGFARTIYDITLVLTQEDTVNGRCGYNEQVFKAWEVELLIQHFKLIIDSVLTNPNINISDIPMASKEEEDKVLTQFNQTDLPLSNQDNFLDLFKIAAVNHSQKTALICNGKSINYSELDAKTERLAQVLYQKAQKAQFCGKEHFVAIYLNRSIESIIAMIAALKAGCAYVPLALDVPLQRIESQLLEMQPVALITEDGLLDTKTAPPFGLVQEQLLDIYDVDIFKSESSLQLPTVQQSDLAYMIYTSGTTGQPKGVMIEHGSLFNLIHWYTRKFFISSDDEVTTYAPFVFDASVWEIFPALSQGAGLHIFTEETRRDILKIQTYLKTHKITVCYFLSQVAELIDGQDLEDLRIMLSGGDVISQTLSDGDYAHWNSYGPTEFTVTATCALLDGSFPVPIGTPVGNSKAYILDGNKRVVGIGKVGELYLAGIQAARGYFNRPDLTEKSFSPSPFHPELRMYKTGDLCRFLPQGQIEYLGRVDEQVKINGHRIELTEIEKVLKDLPEVKQAVVVCHAESLYAYVVIRENINIKAVFGIIKNKLPKYMVPADITQVSDLPYTASGKIDKKQLISLSSVLHNSTIESSIKPSSLTEIRVAKIWAEVLNFDNISHLDIQTNFYDLGGTTLCLMRLASLLKSRLGSNISISQLKTIPTIREIAQEIDSTLGKKREIPLTPIQKWFFSLDVDHNHFHQSVLLEFKENIGTQELKKVLSFISQKHEMLRASFTDNEHSLRILPTEERGFGVIECESGELENVVKRVSTSMDIANKPLAWAVISTNQNNQSVIALIIHHLVVDQVSWAFLNESFITALKQLRQHPDAELTSSNTNENNLSETGGSFSEWSHRINRLSDSQTITSQFPYWEKAVKVPKHAVLFSDGFKHEKIINNRRLSKINNVQLCFDSQITASFTKQLSSGRDNVATKLLSVIATSLNTMFQVEHILLTMEHHGRVELFEDFHLAGNIGWFTLTYPMGIKIHDNIVDNVEEVAETIARVPDNGVGYGLLTQCNEQKTSLRESLHYNGDILFNYLGEFTDNNQTDSEVKIISSGFDNDISGDFIQAEKLNITAIIKNQQLEITLSYHQKEYAVEQIVLLTTNIKKLVTGRLYPDK